MVSCYRASDSWKIDSTTWNNFFSQFSGRTLVGGDFNAHHPLWGDPRSCVAGLDLVSGLGDSQFSYLNTGSPTYVSSINFMIESCIDLTFVNAVCGLDFEWSVDPDLWGSDHFSIIISWDSNHNYIKHSGGFRDSILKNKLKDVPRIDELGHFRW